jgi:hypothetical protein
MAEKDFFQAIEDASVPLGERVSETKALPSTTEITDYSPPPDPMETVEQFTPMGAPGPQPEEDFFTTIEALSAPLSPSLEEVSEEIGTGLLQGAKTGLTVGPPVLMGGVYGAKVGLLGGPAAPVTVPLGSVLGMIGGYVVGSEYSDYLDQFFPMPPRQELIPYRVGAESLTQTLSTIPLAYGIPVMQGNVLSQMLSNIGETARRRPFLFGATESSTAFSTGLGAFISETFNPGDETSRALYEITYGLLSPTRMFSSAATKVADNLQARLGTGALSGKQVKAANQIISILENYKEDPQDVIRALTAATPQGVRPTAGQKTGSPALMALEATLAKEHAAYNDEIRQMGVDSLEAYRVLLAQLRNVGDIDSLRLAAQLQDEQFQALIGQGMLLRQKEAAEAIDKISKLNPNTDARAYVGQILFDKTLDGVKQARNIESEFWQRALGSTLREVEGGVPEYLQPAFRDPLNEVKVSKNQAPPKNITEQNQLFPDAIIGDQRYVIFKNPTTGETRPVYADTRHERIDFSEVVEEKGKYFRLEYDQKKIPKAVRDFYDPSQPRTKDRLEKVKALGNWWEKVPLKKEEIKVDTKLLVPEQFTAEKLRTALVHEAAIKTKAGYNAMPAYFKDLLSDVGIDQDAIDTYRQGMQTQSFLKDQVVPEEFLPSIDLPPIDAAKMIQIRSELLEQTRKAVAGTNPDLDNARLFSEFADTVLDDLEKLDSFDYQIARQYSRALNDVYTRAFGGEMLTKDARGAKRIAPEVLIQTVFSSGSDLTALRMQQIEDAASFLLDQQREIAAKFPRSEQAKLLKQLVPDAKERVKSIDQAQSLVVRLGAANSLYYVQDPVTGEMRTRLDTKKLTKWAAENNQLVRKAGLESDISDATKAENLYKLTLKRNSILNRSIRNKTAFGSLLRSGPDTNPTVVVSSVIRSKSPETGLRRLSLLAKKHGTDAVDGLRSTVMDYAFTQASKQGGFSPTIFQRAMFEPIAAGQPSLYTMMRRQGIMDKSHGKNMQALLVPMMRVERELAGGQTIDDVIKNLGLMGQFATRFVGAQAGSAISRMAGGAGTIQIPAYGASVAQELFDKIPNLSMRKILEDATKDPAFMAQILSKKGIGNTATLTQAKQMHAYLVSQGYTDAEFNEENLPVVPETATTGAPASKLLRQLPRAPQTTGLPFLSSAQAAQPGPAAPGPGPAAPAPQGQPQGSSRQMLQSLFPFDSTLQLPQ